MQEFASQQGYTWQDALEMYEDEAGHVLSVCNISKDGATEWLGEDEIGKLDKGGTGSTVMFTLQLSGYSSCEDVIAGFSVPVEDRAQITSGSWIACVYGSNMARHVAWRARWKTVTTVWISLPRRLSRPVGLPRAAVLRR